MAFLDDLWPTILKASQMTGVDPRIIAAQAKLETGNGQHVPGNNLFGIKGGSGPSLDTTEVVNGQPVRTTAQFRGYASPQDSILGYAEFINKNPRYGPFRSAQGLDAQINALGKSGYATDPNYAAKISSIATGLQPPTMPTMPSPSSPAGGAQAASGMQPFGSMAPSPQSPPASPMVANAGISQEVADHYNNLDKKTPLQKLADALMKTPNAPQASGGGGPAATNGSALLQYLQNPRQLAEMFLKQRLGQG